MNTIDIINKKRLNEELSYDEIKYMVDGFLTDKVKDYQMSAFLMAVTINELTIDEIFSLTDIMIKSGDTLDLSSLKGIIVDKHSTGGVGDKTTLIITPIVASLDIKIAKMSGRGLGHTGGTIDKLEAIKGFKTDLSEKEFINQLKKINVAITSQTGNLVPADKKIYALRDITGTTESIGLIAASIMSKKIASGAEIIVLDVKIGNGALIKNLADAKKLSEIMIQIGKKYNRKVSCLITDMDQPLGKTVGNGLEVLEAIQTLNNNGSSDLTELSIAIASQLVSMANDISIEEAEIKVKETIVNGQAYSKFCELVKMQHGDISKVIVANKQFAVTSTKKGYITKINALKLGELARELGAGRLLKDDIIDHGVGFVLMKKVGDYVNVEGELVRVYWNSKDLKIKDIIDCFEINNEQLDSEPLIYEIVN